MPEEIITVKMRVRGNQSQIDKFVRNLPGELRTLAWYMGIDDDVDTEDVSRGDAP